MRVFNFHDKELTAALSLLVLSTSAFSTSCFTPDRAPMFFTSQRLALHIVHKSTIRRPLAVPFLSRYAAVMKPLCSRASESIEGDIEPIDGSVNKSRDHTGAKGAVGPMVDALLGKTISRAMSTISEDARSASGTQPISDVSENDVTSTRSNVDTSEIIDAVVTRASERMAANSNRDAGNENDSASQSTPKKDPRIDKRKYLSNPAVTPTALAHSLWNEVVQPYEDIIIDATAGNGKDSIVLASMLFPTDGEYESIELPVREGDDEGPKLICIDIQQRACENTLDLLRENFDSDIIDEYIDILHTSHAPLPSLKAESVGLVCYNLGYLPGADKEAFQTQMVTTIYSLADAAILLRDGGLLSVMSYPGNGWIEHCAVNYFMEGLAMFSSKSKGGWRGFVEAIPSDYDLEIAHGKVYGGGQTTITADSGADSIRQTVRLALERVKTDGFEKQTWRVFDHRPLGRPLSPIMYSAMRIK